MLDQVNGGGDDGEDRPVDHVGPGAGQPEVLGDAGDDRPGGEDDHGAEPLAASVADGEDNTVPFEALSRDETVAIDGPGADETVSISALSSDETVPIEGPETDKTVPIEALTRDETAGPEVLATDETVALAGPGAGKTVAVDGVGPDNTVHLARPGGTNAGEPVGPERGGPAKGGSAGWERLITLSRDRWRRSRERLAGGPVGERLERFRATRGGRLAGDGAERLREWGDEHPIARRRLLIAVPSAAGLALVTGAVKAAEPKAKPGRSAQAVVRPRPAHPVEKTTVHKLPVQHKPIFTLSDYRRMTGGPAFPADAIALTIDDGPHPVWTPKILRLLDRYHVPAMFCMIGNQVLGHEAVAQTVTRAGHQLANHTWSHPTQLAGRPRDQVRKEIERAQIKIKDTTGYAPKLFRSPGGDWSPTVLQETANAGLIPLDWDNDPRDWSRPGVAHIKSKLLAARPGQILLCHDGGGDRSQTYAALSAVLPALTARGLRFVAL